MAASAAILLLGLLALGWMLARRGSARIASAPLPPMWSGADGGARVGVAGRAHPIEPAGRQARVVVADLVEDVRGLAEQLVGSSASKRGAASTSAAMSITWSRLR
jgi:hypothetical protein